MLSVLWDLVFLPQMHYMKYYYKRDSSKIIDLDFARDFKDLK